MVGVALIGVERTLVLVWLTHRLVIEDSKPSAPLWSRKPSSQVPQMFHTAHLSLMVVSTMLYHVYWITHLGMSPTNIVLCILNFLSDIYFVHFECVIDVILTMKLHALLEATPQCLLMSLNSSRNKIDFLSQLDKINTTFNSLTDKFGTFLTITSGTSLMLAAHWSISILTAASPSSLHDLPDLLLPYLLNGTFVCLRSIRLGLYMYYAHKLKRQFWWVSEKLKEFQQRNRYSGDISIQVKKLLYRYSQVDGLPVPDFLSKKTAIAIIAALVSYLIFVTEYRKNIE